MIYPTLNNNVILIKSGQLLAHTIDRNRIFNAILVDAEILVKVPYTASNNRFEYKLTEKGLDLYPILMSMAHNTWMDQGHGAPIDYIHKECGHVFKPVLVCSHCKIPLHEKDVQPVPVNGFVPVTSRFGT